MTQQNLLPKFCSVKTDDNGDHAEMKSVAAPGAPFGAEKPSGAKLTLRGGRPVPSPLKSGIIKRVFGKLKLRKFMQIASLKTTLVSTSNETAAQHAFPQGRWSALSKSPLFRNPFATTRKLRAEQAPLQTELALDSIKPVRNDLSDRDADMISADERERISAPPGFAACDAPGSVSAGDRKAPVSERVKTQLFDAEEA
jgi:hypothetical protein